MKEQDQEVMSSQKQESCAVNKADPVPGCVSRIIAWTTTQVLPKNAKPVLELWTSVSFQRNVA